MGIDYLFMPAPGSGIKSPSWRAEPPHWRQQSRSRLLGGGRAAAVAAAKPPPWRRPNNRHAGGGAAALAAAEPPPWRRRSSRQGNWPYFMQAAPGVRKAAFPYDPYKRETAIQKYVFRNDVMMRVVVHRVPVGKQGHECQVVLSTTDKYSARKIMLGVGSSPKKSCRNCDSKRKIT